MWAIFTSIHGSTQHIIKSGCFKLYFIPRDMFSLNGVWEIIPSLPMITHYRSQSQGTCDERKTAGHGHS